ncbi:hypothetical protein MM440_03580 [Arsenicicoccus piscis]|nr:hypothetical protein [Arsenicicoccus piscis]MCH8626886.1 hypothetical protein [Arsenicicoccus piscis]
MSNHDADIAESRDLARMIVTVAERARADFAAAVEPLGVPVHLARTVLLLGEPQSMRYVAGELACDPSHVTGIADHLEERGLAVRAPGADRRIKMLNLTEDGEALRQQLAEAVNTKAKFAGQLDAGQKQTLRELLGLLLEPRSSASAQTTGSKEKTA